MRYARKIQIILLICMMILGCSAFTIKAEAAKKKTKSKVSWKLKKGTLTISGKGAMPKSMTFRKQKKKIKKVVIKKGVTSVSERAFYKCKKLKEVKLPSTLKKIDYESFADTGLTDVIVPASVKKIGQNTFANCKKLKRATIPGDFKFKEISGEERHTMLGCQSELQSLTFNSELSLDNAARFYTDNFYVWKGDKKYKSIDGVIYTKDGKTIVRVPSLRKSLTIAEGCTEFPLQSVLYCPLDMENEPMGGCPENLKKITIPESVSRINVDKYIGGVDTWGESGIDTVVLKSQKLDGHSIMVLVNEINKIKLEDWTKICQGQIVKSSNMYTTYDGVLLCYTGKEKRVKLPKEITEIGNNAFYQNESLETVELPEGVTQIGSDAFTSCANLSAVNFPKSLKVIGDYAFNGCHKLKKIPLLENIKSYGRGAFMSTGITEIRLPSDLKYISEELFAYTALKSVVIPDSVEVIKAGAFHGCKALKKVSLGKRVKTIENIAFADTCLSDVLIPSNIVQINEYAFSNIDIAEKELKVTVMGATKKIDAFAFGADNAVITYKSSIKNYKTALTYTEWNYTEWTKKGKKQYIRCKWNKLTGISGYQLKVSPDKKFKKGVKSFNVKKNKTAAGLVYWGKKNAVYAKIRPYKIRNGKKVYGMWTKAEI